MPQSDRALEGYLTQGSKSIVVGVDDDQKDFFDNFRQGVNLRSYSDLTNFFSLKIRCNSDPINTLNGRRSNLKHFDDSLQSNGSSFDNQIKISSFFDHESERRDLGQIDIWELKFGSMVDRSNPLKDIVQKNGNLIQITKLEPVFLIDTNIGGLPLDGFIEPTMARAEAERNHPDHPFKSKGIRANVGQIEDPFRNNDLIRTGYNVPKNSQETYHLSSLHFLDATEYYGPIELMPVFAEDRRNAIPFKDRSNDRELLYKNEKIDDEIASVLTDAAYSITLDDNMIEFDIMGRNGWIFNEAGGRALDSIVYGGLARG
jgi:hypothetical protein